MRELNSEVKQAIRDAYARLAELPNFATRRSQREMIALVAEALATPGGVAAIQAPTGTGKSIGALLPAIPVARAFQRKIVVSTATVALQEQYLREIPNLLRLMGLSMTVALAKGRQRYLCNRQLAELAADHPLDEQGFELDPAWPRPPKAGEAQLVEALADALVAGWGGDLDNAPTPIPPELRPLLTTTSSSCGGRLCPFADRCAYLRARDAVAAADIVVTNHDLLLADLGLHREPEAGPPLPGGLLLPGPEESFYLIDEGHHLAAKASEADAVEVFLSGAPAWLKKGGKALAAAYRLLDRDRVRAHTLQEAQSRLSDAIAEIRTLAETLALQAEGRLDRAGNLVFKGGRLPTALQEAVAPVAGDLAVLADIACDLAERLRKRPSTTPVEQAALRSIGQFADRLSPLRDWAHDWTRGRYGSDTPVARWLSVVDGRVTARSQPCEGRALLQGRLWPVADGTILTSATLAIADDFGHFAHEVGLPASATVASLPSPFNLREQGLLRLPPIATDPNDPSHPAEVATFLHRGISEGGGVLVLFTSKAKMAACHAALPESLRAAVLMQGEAPLQALLERHRQRIAAGQHSLLFGMSLMGEGIDLAGDLCRTVVITGLPFTPPDDPVTATLADHIESQGGDAFAELTIPRVTLQLVQWCGRLIRTHDDQGEVVILDRRLTTKRYGRRILEALPPFARDDR